MRAVAAGRRAMLDQQLGAVGLVDCGVLYPGDNYHLALGVFPVGAAGCGLGPAPATAYEAAYIFKI